MKRILHITTIVEWRGGDAQMKAKEELMKVYDPNFYHSV